MSDTRYSAARSLNVVLVIAVASAVLVPVISVLYSYDARTLIESGIGFSMLLATVGFLLLYRKRLNRLGAPAWLAHTTFPGAILGLLWTIEIAINNLVAPPLPLRDRIDGIFWAAIALGIFILAILGAYRTGSLLRGIKVGAWSGLVSGLIACGTALSLIVFGIHWITHDPLNVAEWTARQAETHAPTMAAYFAFETFAGALLHLTVLGLVMGVLLGVVGGIFGKGVGYARRRLNGRS